jgi:hypothetical protein
MCAAWSLAGHDRVVSVHRPENGFSIRVQEVSGPSDKDAVKLDERGVIADWLVKLVAGLAIVGIVLFDAGSVLVNFFTLDSTADDIATEITHSLANKEINPTQHDVALKAKELAKEAEVRLVKVEIDPQGVLHIELRRTASTLVIKRISPIEDWAVATADADAATS